MAEQVSIEPTSEDIKDIDSLFAKAKGAAPVEPATDEDEEEPEAPVKDEPPKKEPPKKEAPKEEKPADEPPKDDVPVDDSPQETEEERIERLAEERAQKRIEAERQAIVDAIIKKERQREDNALKKLRDLEIAAGKKADELIADRRAARVEDVKQRYAMDDAEALEYVRVLEENERHKATEAEREREREEEKRTVAYQSDKNAYLNNTSISVEERAFARKYADEIDAFTEGGRNQISFETARLVIFGKHAKEIMESARTPAPKKDTVKVAPTSTPSSSEPAVPERGRALGQWLGLSNKDIRDAYASQKKRK